MPDELPAPPDQKRSLEAGQDLPASSTSVPKLTRRKATPVEELLEARTFVNTPHERRQIDRKLMQKLRQSVSNGLIMFGAAHLEERDDPDDGLTLLDREIPDESSAKRSQDSPFEDAQEGSHAKRSVEAGEVGSVKPVKTVQVEPRVSVLSNKTDVPLTKPIVLLPTTTQNHRNDQDETLNRFREGARYPGTLGGIMFEKASHWHDKRQDTFQDIIDMLLDGETTYRFPQKGVMFKAAHEDELDGHPIDDLVAK